MIVIKAIFIFNRDTAYGFWCKLSSIRSRFWCISAPTASSKPLPRHTATVSSLSRSYPLELLRCPFCSPLSWCVSKGRLFWILKDIPNRKELSFLCFKLWSCENFNIHVQLWNYSAYMYTIQKTIEVWFTSERAVLLYKTIGIRVTMKNVGKFSYIKKPTVLYH